MPINPLPQAMILAAGFGLRARPLTLVRPKPMFPVLDQTLIQRALANLAAVGVTRVVVNTHHLADRLITHLEGLDQKPPIRILEEKTILGTGGGIRNAGPYLGNDPFWVINSDIYTDIDLEAVLADHLTHRPLATLVMHDYPRFNQVVVDEAGNILGFGVKPEERTENGRVLAFTGIHIIDPAVITRIPEGPADIIPVYRQMIEDGLPIRAHVARNHVWWDSGTLDGYLDIHAHVLSNRAEGPLYMAPGAVVEDGAEIRGWVGLGEDSIIKKGARVTNSVLWPGAIVERGAVVERSVVTDGAKAEGRIAGKVVTETLR